MLWLRDFAATEAVPLPGTDGAGFPFWSPDSKSIAFFGGGYLKRIDIAGGSPQILCAASFGRGGSWSVNDVIIFSPGGNSPLYQIAANGGTLRQLTQLDVSRHDVSHRLPCFLPDGKHFIYLIRRPSVGETLGESLNVASLDSPVPRHLIDTSSNVDFVDPGYLLFLRNQRLVKQRFNVRTLQLEGEAAPPSATRSRTTPPASARSVPRAAEFWPSDRVTTSGGWNGSIAMDAASRSLRP